MKTKQLMMMTLLFLGVLLEREAQAFYNPSTGRWLSRDSIGEGDEPNLFLFAINCPVTTIDYLGESSISTVGTIYARSTPSAKVGNQLDEWQRSLKENTIVFYRQLVALCPNCEPVEFTSLNGKRTQTCTLSKCLVQAQELAFVLARAYSVVFTSEYKKFGNILVGLGANERALQAPNRGTIAEDYDKGFGLKCTGWMDLTASEFWKATSRHYKAGSQCFRAAIVGKPADRDSWFNHSWTVIYGPKRGQLNTSMFKKGDYDFPIDPWPVAGKIITPVIDKYEAERFDQSLAW